MSTLTVSNIQTSNATIPLTLTTGNTTAGKIIVNNDEVIMFANATTNVTINSSSIAIGGDVKISSPNVTGNRITVTRQLIFSGNVTPTKIAANTSAWNPGTGVYNIRAEANSTTVYYSLFGLTAGLDGQEITITNINATPLIIRNEDSVNESTAANRFNMPNHIKLDGYMSAQFYYDGTLDRWRLIDSVNIPFDHKYSLTKGFFSGGLTPGATTTTDKTTYSTETTAVTASAALSSSRYHHVGSGNADKGFLVGGVLGSSPTVVTTTTNKTTYSTDTTASAATTISATQLHGGAGNADKGFHVGGFVAPGVGTAVSSRITYSSETGATISSLPSANYDFIGSASNADKSFFMGGAAVQANYKMTHSTESSTVVSGAISSQSRYSYGSSASGNADKGFFTGGQTPVVVLATTDRTTYSSETTAAVSGANLSQARSAHASAGNADKGFHCGGTTGSVVATADRTTYSTETTAAVSGANLSQVRYGLSGV
jgi:hypothetical protein